eukprot:scaffold40532_cov72-Skeletonema_dohrnii-CCMP3373.AAC.1
MNRIPKSGVHNPLKNVERYLQFGEISRRAGAALSDPIIAEFFIQTIQKTVPKSHAQAAGEVKVTADFLNNFGGDNVRFLARSFGVPGDHYGQFSNGHRWPYGPVAIIAPFNFPLEIPVLQLMGALFMGNKPVLKPAEKSRGGVIDFELEYSVDTVYRIIACGGYVAGEDQGEGQD